MSGPGIRTEEVCFLAENVLICGAVFFVFLFFFHHVLLCGLLIRGLMFLWQVENWFQVHMYDLGQCRAPT